MADAESSVVSTLFGWTGRRSLRLGAYLLDLTSFIISAVRERGGQRHYFNRANINMLVTQINFTGVDALPVVTLLALAIGSPSLPKSWIWVRRSAANTMWNCCLPMSSVRNWHRC